MDRYFGFGNSVRIQPHAFFLFSFYTVGKFNHFHLPLTVSLFPDYINYNLCTLCDSKPTTKNKFPDWLPEL